MCTLCVITILSNHALMMFKLTMALAPVFSSFISVSTAEGYSMILQQLTCFVLL